MKHQETHFTALAPLLTAAGLQPPTEAEKRLCGLQASMLEAMSEIEQNHPNEAWKTLHQALQEAA